MKKILITIILMTLTACGGNNSDLPTEAETSQQKQTNDDKKTKVPAGIAISHKVIHQGENGSVENGKYASSFYKVIENQADYAKILADEDASAPQVAIDFTKQKVVMYSAGMSHAGDTKITVKSVYDDGNTINAVIESTKNGKNCDKAGSYTASYIFFTVDTTKSINVQTSRVIKDCAPKVG